MNKKYMSLESLQVFKMKADNLYATKQNLDELSAYIFNIDYNALSFDTTEIVIDTSDSNPTTSSTISMLGRAILGQMILA